MRTSFKTSLGFVLFDQLCVRQTSFVNRFFRVQLCMFYLVCDFVFDERVYYVVSSCVFQLRGYYLVCGLFVN